MNICESPFNWEKYHTITITGQKGAGKTVALKIFAEELYKVGKPTIIFDVLGNIEVENYKILKKVKPSNAYKVISHIKSKWLIIDISQNTIKDMQKIVNGICDVIISRKLAFAILVDEIADLIPQHGAYADRLRRLVRIGRNFNCTPIIFCTQRPQMVSKWVYALGDIHIWLRMNYYLDREIARQQLAMNREDFAEYDKALRSFKMRECYVMGYDFVLPERTKVRWYAKEKKCS